MGGYHVKNTEQGRGSCARNRITCEILETNLSGQLFLRSQGLRAVSVLRDYYDDITEDAYVMLYRVNSNQGAIL